MMIIWNYFLDLEIRIFNIFLWSWLFFFFKISCFITALSSNILVLIVFLVDNMISNAIVLLRISSIIIICKFETHGLRLLTHVLRYSMYSILIRLEKFRLILHAWLRFNMPINNFILILFRIIYQNLSLIKSSIEFSNLSFIHINCFILFYFIFI